MASPRVLLVVALLGLAMAPAEGEDMNAKLGQGMRANVAGDGVSLDANVGSVMVASVGEEGAGVKVSVGEVMPASEGARGGVKWGGSGGVKPGIKGLKERTTRVGQAVGKMIKKKGAQFFQMLLEEFSDAAELVEVFKAPAKATAEAVNKRLADFAAKLKKMVDDGDIALEHADILRRQIVLELKSALKGKFNIDLLKMS